MPSKSGRHHNRKGKQQIKNGSTKKFVKRIAKKLKIKYQPKTAKA